MSDEQDAARRASEVRSGRIKRDAPELSLKNQLKFLDLMRVQELVQKILENY